MIRVLTYANKLNGSEDCYLALEKSVVRKGIYFGLTVEARKWSVKNKIEWKLEMSQRYPADQIVFVDAYDMLFVGEKDELQDILNASELIFPTDAGPAPWPYEHYEESFTKRRHVTSKWRYVNGSGPAGYGWAISKAIKYGFLHYAFKERNFDQGFWANVYLDGWGELDQGCQLTQNIFMHPAYWNSYMVTKPGDTGVRNGRYYNFITGSRPQFIHAMGGSWDEIPKELIPGPEEVSPIG